MDNKEKAFADLRVHYQTGCSYLISGAGRNKVTGYRNGVMTNLGDLDLSDWQNRASALIARYEEEMLLEDLYRWLSEHNYPQDSVKELRMRALELHMARIFDNPAWVDYIPWNRRFRAGILDESRFIWVETECCHETGPVTEEQIKKAYENRICCPHCGRFSAYTICPENRKENAHVCE
jgi:hypothetical protein